MPLTTYTPLGSSVTSPPPPVHPRALDQTSTDGNTKPEPTPPLPIRPPEPSASKARTFTETPFTFPPLAYSRMVYFQTSTEVLKPNERRRPPRLSSETMSELSSLATEKDSLSRNDEKQQKMVILYLIMILALIDYPLLSGTETMMPPVLCALLTGFIAQSHYCTNSNIGGLLTILSSVHFIFVLIISAVVECTLAKDPALYFAAACCVIWSCAALILIVELNDYRKLFFDYDKFTRAASDLVDINSAEDKTATSELAALTSTT